MKELRSSSATRFLMRGALFSTPRTPNCRGALEAGLVERVRMGPCLILVTAVLCGRAFCTRWMLGIRYWRRK